MNKQDLVCVCIPTYERASLLRLCVESILAQTYKNISIHIFDNSKTDAVFDVVQSLDDGRIHYERNIANISDIPLINHRKVFIPQAGRYQMLLTSDWALRADAIELMVAELESNTDIVAVTSGSELRDLNTGESWFRPRRLKKFAKSDESGSHWIDTRSLIHACFEGYSGVGFCYHSLIVTDILRHGAIAPVYYGQASEHEAGLDLAILAPRVGLINECLLIGFKNSERYNPGTWRGYKVFSEALARARFFDRRYPELVAKDFDTARMQRGLVRWLLRSAFIEPAHAGGALVLARRYGLPWWATTTLWWILLPLRMISALKRAADKAK